jgi:hypothetical protein
MSAAGRRRGDTPPVPGYYLDGNVYGLVTIALRVTAAAGEPIASPESREIRFVPVAEIDELELFPTHRPIIDAYLSGPTGVVVA